MYFEGIVILILVVLLNKYILDFILNTIFGKKKTKEGKKLTNDYLNAMFEFFKAKERDKIKAAEKALLLQRDFGFKNAGRILVLGIYIIILFRGLGYLFGDKIFLYLPFYGVVGWVGTFILFNLFRFILHKIIKGFFNE